MSLARKCDRCGKLYESYNVKDSTDKINALMLLNIDLKSAYFSHGPYDLCPDCSNEFMAWFKKGE